MVDEVIDKTYNMIVECGATFKRSLLWKDSEDVPINITGYSARMQIRKKITDADPIVSLSSTDGTIELGGSAGTVILNMSATVTAAITITSGVYDLELVSASGFVTRLIEGTVTFRKDVTR